MHGLSQRRPRPERAGGPCRERSTDRARPREGVVGHLSAWLLAQAAHQDHASTTGPGAIDRRPRGLPPNALTRPGPARALTLHGWGARPPRGAAGPQTWSSRPDEKDGAVTDAVGRECGAAFPMGRGRLAAASFSGGGPIRLFSGLASPRFGRIPAVLDSCHGSHALEARRDGWSGAAGALFLRRRSRCSSPCLVDNPMMWREAVP